MKLHNSTQPSRTCLNNDKVRDQRTTSSLYNLRHSFCSLLFLFIYLIDANPARPVRSCSHRR